VTDAASAAALPSCGSAANTSVINCLRCSRASLGHEVPRRRTPSGS
jgi:hypothetical protein